MSIRGVHVVLLWLFLFFTCTLSQADCPHCYRIAKVTLSEYNGKTRVGYTPVYFSMLDSTGDEKIEAEADLKKILNVRKGEIAFFEKFYSFENIGNVISTEDVEVANMDSISSLIFISWENFMGASKLPTLPLSKIIKLKEKKILHVERIEGSVAEFVFVNVNPEIPQNEFKLLVKYRGTRLSSPDNFFYLASTLNDHFSQQHIESDIQPKIQRVMEALDELIEHAESSIDELSQSHKNKTITFELSQEKEMNVQRHLFCTGLKDYLLNGEITSIGKFIQMHKTANSLKNIRVPLLHESDEAQLRLMNARTIFSQFYPQLRDTFDREHFDNLLDSLDIIMIRFYFD